MQCDVQVKSLHSSEASIGVYDKGDEQTAIAKHGVSPIGTKWIDTDKAFEGEPTTKRRGQAIVARSDFPWKGLKATLSIAANHWRPFGRMHFDVSRAHFTSKAQRPVLARVRTKLDG